MKVLRVEAPGTSPGVAASVGRAVAEFNRGLDIRLRFLSIGIEDSVVQASEAASAADAVAAAIAASAPDLVVLFGDGPAALAAAGVAIRSNAMLVRVGAGRRDGESADAARAIDRLAAIHLVHDAAAVAALDAESAPGQRIDIGDAADPAAGERIVRALSRARRTAQNRTTGGV